MQTPNNLMQAIQQVRKMVGNGDPNVFLQNFVEQNHVPQSMLSEAQRQSRELLKTLTGK